MIARNRRRAVLGAVPCVLLAFALFLPGCASSNSAVGRGAATAAPPVPAAYRIGPEDVLNISVWENKELTRDIIVRPDGKISLPLIQDVQAEGLTSVELAESIQQKLQPFIRDPSVSVIVKEVNAAQIFILGYVHKPGKYPLRGDLSVLQALSMAGGFTEFASPKKIRIVRRRGGEQEIRMVNYNKIISSGEGNYLLKPGDTIVVP